MKTISTLLVVAAVFAFAVSPCGAQEHDITDEALGKDSVLSVPFRLGGDLLGRGTKFLSAMLGGNYYRDYGDTGYRHGGYAYEYDYGKNGDGANGYGYNHQGLDGYGYSGV